MISILRDNSVVATNVVKIHLHLAILKWDTEIVIMRLLFQNYIDHKKVVYISDIRDIIFYKLQRLPYKDVAIHHIQLNGIPDPTYCGNCYIGLFKMCSRFFLC